MWQQMRNSNDAAIGSRTPTARECPDPKKSFRITGAPSFLSPARQQQQSRSLSHTHHFFPFGPLQPPLKINNSRLIFNPPIKSFISQNAHAFPFLIPNGLYKVLLHLPIDPPPLQQMPNAHPSTILYRNPTRGILDGRWEGGGSLIGRNVKGPKRSPGRFSSH